MAAVKIPKGGGGVNKAIGRGAPCWKIPSSKQLLNDESEHNIVRVIKKDNPIFYENASSVATIDTTFYLEMETSFHFCTFMYNEHNYIIAGK